MKRRQFPALYKAVALFLITSTLIVIYYIRTWSTSGMLRAAIPETVVKMTNPFTIVHTQADEEILNFEPEKDVVDDAAVIISSSSCMWDPRDDSHTNCTDLLSLHLATSLNRSRTLYLSQQQQSVPSLLNRRWLLLGDSTFLRMFRYLRQYLTTDTVQQYIKYRATQQRCHDNPDDNNRNVRDDFHCSHITASRCNSMEQFHLTRLPTTQPWELPDFSNGEGPVKFGYDHSYCTDCDGCDSHIVSCAISDDDTVERCNNDIDSTDPVTAPFIGPSYGGYISIEFARDVELQTLAYGTTQENFLLKYIANEWNPPTIIREFGRPICVVGTGHHDAAVPNITLHVYLQNVQWYLELIMQQCDYIIWISNNAPATDEYHQTVRGTYEWNIAVRDMFFLSNKNRSIRSNIFLIDVFNASQTYDHDDNIHMADAWYQSLASFLQNVMQNMIT